MSFVEISPLRECKDTAQLGILFVNGIWAGANNGPSENTEEYHQLLDINSERGISNLGEIHSLITHVQ